MAAAADTAPAPDPELVQLRSSLALARSDSFYLVLDLRQAELRLMLGGVALRTFPYTEAAVGSPRRALLPGPAPRDWTERVWREGELAPERRRERAEIVPPRADGPRDDAAPAIPPAPEDAQPSPPRYRVEFADGLELEIRRSGDSTGTGLGERLRLLADPRQERLRLRLTLDPDGAATLYRCLPPRISLVVLGRQA